MTATLTLRERIARFSQAGPVRWGAGVGEQGLVAVTSLATLAVLSRLTNLHELGIVATSLALWLLVEALQRATVILPFIATVPQPEREPYRLGAFMVLNLAFCIAAAVLLAAAAAALVPLHPDMAQAALLGAPLAAAGCMFLFVRHAAYQLQQPLLAVVNSSGVALVSAIGLALLWQQGQTNPSQAALVIALAYGLPSLAIGLWIGRHARFSLRALRALAAHSRLMKEFAAASLALHIATNGAQLVLGFVAGPAPVAVFALGRTLVRPLTLMVHAIVDSERARLARHLAEGGIGSLDAGVSKARTALVLLCTPAIAAVLLFPEPLLLLFYGDAGSNAATAARLWAIALIPFILYEPLEAALSVLRESRTLARANLLALGVMALVVLLALLLDGFTATTAILSVGTAYATCMVIIYRRYGIVRGRLELAS